MSTSPHTSQATAGTEVAHPVLRAQLAELGLLGGEAPGHESWAAFLTEVERRYELHDRAQEGSEHFERGWSSFENLFRSSPIPTMEQDYTAVMAWMDRLRARGVTDLGAHLGDDIERFREVAGMIRMVAANPAAVEVIGIAEHEVIGPVDPAIVNHGSLDGWRSQLQAVWDGTPLSEASFVGAKASGEVFDARSTLSAPLVDGVPDFTRAVLTILDVTAQRDEERRMRGHIEAKNQFLASVSHEIRTPLTAVLGFARLLTIADADEVFAPDERREMLAAIHDQASDVTNLVEDLLVAARAEIGQLAIVAQPFDVQAQVLQTLEAGGSFTRRVSVSSDQVARAVGDPARFRQILRNLLTNAERYGGPDVRVAVAEEGAQVVVEVSDDGPGLEVDEWERIFEPYHRAHQSPGQPSAVGIGLAICRQLADLMSATLAYRYDGGRSVFRLALQAHSGTAPEVCPSA